MRERIVIVGGGIAGLSTAWHLAQSGTHDIVLIERESTLASQATAQNAAILRTTIDDPPTAALAARSAAFLARPPNGFEPLLDACGMVVVTRADFGPPLGLRRGAQAQRLDAARLRALVPDLAANRGDAWLVDGEGRVDVGALARGFETGARARGVAIETGARVRRLHAGAHGVELDDGTSIAADQVVIAAGAWAAPLAQAIGSRVELSPTRRHLIVTRPDERIDPRGPIVWSDVDDIYTRPEADGLMVCPCDEEDVDPDTLVVSADALSLTRRKCAAAFGTFQPLAPARFWAGLRTHAADRRFVLGRDPDVPGLVWAAGLGGHGITCSVAVGEIAAAAVLGSAMPADLIEPFSPARFAAIEAQRS
jgi:D-arginine dehydrogenase